ncbi:MAG: 4a-hydroxytetrahydrobiopterin dehydratase [Firmicutes bacterium]|nr:4a-hydroxytetrahydrobiopterin dehydratase [Bacillota bacterium]
MGLLEKKCVPCEGGVPPFTIEEAEKYLSQVKEWNPGENFIEKEFKFKNFRQALEFVNKVGKIAESEAHHPDIFIHSYRKVKIILSTHAIKGLSENDFIIAAKIDQLIKQ